MNKFLSPHARTVLLGDRQCTATTRDGTRCGRASALGAFVCNLHGARSPLSMKAARERLMMLAEPALDALLRALQTAPPCEVCGRSDADKDPTVIRAAQIVLDRAGLGPQMKVEVAQPENEFENATIDELIERLERMLADARATRDLERAQRGDVTDGVVIDDGFDVPEDDAEPEPAPHADEGLRSIPPGDVTKEPASD